MKDDYFLGVDIGNTHTVLGLFDYGQILKTWRISTKTDATCHEVVPLLSFWLKNAKIALSQIRGVIMSSVVPPAGEMWNQLTEQYLGIKPIDAHAVAEKIIKIKYPRPHEIGTDRLVNSIAAFTRFKRACIVADFGTATTFDWISEKGEYLGGSIAPGIAMSLEALFLKTSKLPLVKLEAEKVPALGRNTEEAIRSGILYGFGGLTDNIITELSSQCRTRPVAVATGGLAPLIYRFTKKIDHIAPELTMEGLKICMEASCLRKDR